MNLTLRNRIATFNSLATAILILILFVAIYFVVNNTVYEKMDNELRQESYEFISDYKIVNGVFVFKHPFSWAAGGHGNVEATPIFVQVLDTNGSNIQKTSNLLQESLIYQNTLKEEIFFSSVINGKPIRQYQAPIINRDKKNVGTILVAIPLKEATMVLQNLFVVLVVAYPIFLIALFTISRSIAGKTIEPINEVITTAEKITKENLSERIPFPKHKDEIYLLSKNINELLSRLEEALLREKQFTADASHELRTPLSVIQGTLEVLIRKPRTPEQYTAKISDVMKETKRMSELIDQLLFLARHETSSVRVFLQPINVDNLFEDMKNRYAEILKSKNLTFQKSIQENVVVKAEFSMLTIIIENLLSNAIKYSNSGGTITFSVKMLNKHIAIQLTDTGIGIKEEQIKNIFNRFFRTEESRKGLSTGIGLGLSIVKKLSELQNISLGVESVPNEGTTFTLLFPES
ncbi:MAG: HAMP domain-containing histidine kinase [Ignavibacteriaceae bacterium]|jgi:signal transduction histidine kinase|nr:HAMP domain-containing histidine kinase [Ignavibacteriaceae bacterium]